MVCSSSAWGIQPRAGAAEPGNAGASESGNNKTEDDETVLRVAYYNVGLQQTVMDTKSPEKAKTRSLCLTLFTIWKPLPCKRALAVAAAASQVNTVDATYMVSTTASPMTYTPHAPFNISVDIYTIIFTIFCLALGFVLGRATSPSA